MAGSGRAATLSLPNWYVAAGGAAVPALLVAGHPPAELATDGSPVLQLKRRELGSPPYESCRPGHGLIIGLARVGVAG